MTRLLVFAPLLLLLLTGCLSNGRFYDHLRPSSPHQTVSSSILPVVPT